MIDLRGNPFFLDDGGVRWVEETLAKMTEDEKLGQLLCLITYSDDEETCRYLGEKIKPGGFMSRTVPLSQCVETVKRMQKYSEIPLLVSANLESGGNGIVEEGTKFQKPLGVAAARDPKEQARRLGEICGREGSAVGANWSFAPIGDIDFNWRNPITNTRTYGSDPKTVKECTLAYLTELQKYEMAACLKHFPGDGRDERDQHISPSVNDMSVDDWMKTYGEIYRAGIEAGVKTVMVGHLLFPAYLKKVCPELPEEEYLPATLSEKIVSGLLRKELHFNGLIVTDSSIMTGISAFLPREELVPLTIKIGCDMLLFTKNLEEDLVFLKKGLQKGIITKERLDEAVTRILALKASLHLHEKQKDKTLFPSEKEARETVGNPKFLSWAKECAKESVTLVKEEREVLPITPVRYPRVLFVPLEKASDGISIFSGDSSSNERFAKRLEEEGFIVERFSSRPGFEGMLSPVKEMEKYDLILYSAALSTKSNQTVVRIEWANPMGANTPVYCHSIPTVFVSFENPYHLVDVPQMRTYINCYSFSETILEELMKKLTGKEAFLGKSPVDPFCGKWEAKLSYFGKKRETRNPAGGKKEIKGILFDLDGVLVFTDRLHYRAWAKIANEYGLFYDESVNSRFRGVAREDCVRILTEQANHEFSEEEKAKIAEEKNEYYREFLKELTPAAIPENVRNMLIRLRKEGYLLAVASSSKNAKTILRVTDSEKYFDAVIDGTCIKKSKPDPEVFIRAAEILQLSPENCLVVEDADAGLLAASRAGMQSVGVGEGKEIPSVEFLETKLKKFPKTPIFH